MSILQQIRSDAAYLKGLIASLSSECTSVTVNGVALAGNQLEAALASARASNGVKLKEPQ